jgi:type I restriction-modification system DNA methylase subunit
MFTVFKDFLEMTAIAISNAVDLYNRPKREKRYLEIIKRYEKDELMVFPELLNELIEELEKRPRDVLGSLFMELEISSNWHGQFFTPMEVSELMTELMIPGYEEKIKEKGFITINDPAVGGGATIIALTNTLKSKGYNYQKVMRVVAQDIDIKSVHMCYVQFSLLGIDAVVMRGDTLTMKYDNDVWKTPNHIIKWSRWPEHKPAKGNQPEQSYQYEQLALF